MVAVVKAACTGQISSQNPKIRIMMVTNKHGDTWVGMWTAVLRQIATMEAEAEATIRMMGATKETCIANVI